MELSLSKNEKYARDFVHLLDIMDTLRGENGCPWDKEQEIDDIISYLIDESYELLQAEKSGEVDKLIEELTKPEEMSGLLNLCLERLQDILQNGLSYDKTPEQIQEYNTIKQNIKHFNDFREIVIKEFPPP